MAVASLTQQKPNLETYSLIWLDSSLNNSQETIQALQYLRTIINYLKLIKETDECEEYIRSVPKDDRIILIVSGRLGQEIVPRIHHLQQISSIYVYCMNKKKNEQWVQPFNKIKRIIVSLSELVNKIRDDQIERQRNTVTESFSMNIFQSNIIDKELNNSLFYSHLLIDCLIQTNSALTDKNDLISLCKKQYEGNDTELQIVEEFEQNYFPSRALWWYTRQSFLYRLLNKALQIQNIELLLLFRFFIRDIERQLEKTKCTSPVHVYYGQLMSNEELQILRNNTGGFILINSFLSTRDKQQIETYFSQIESSNDYQRVLFDIEADPRLENIKPFSHITTQGYFPNDEQTIFMLGSIFRLSNVRHEQSGMWIVRMILCSESYHQLKAVFHPQQTKDSLFFGQEFCELRRFDDAEKYYLHLMKSLPSDHEDLILYNDALGHLEQEKNDYDSSLQYFNKSLESNSNFKKKFNENHPKIAICFNNIGHIYKKDKKYSKALESYQKAFVIRQKCFSQDHPQLADSYKNIATTYEYLDNPDQALENYNQALKIYTKSVSPSHFVIGMILKSIGGIYENKKQFQQAHSYYEKAMTSFRYVLSATDQQIVQIQQDIQRVTEKLK